MYSGGLDLIRKYLLILFPYCLIFSMPLSNLVAILLSINIFAKCIIKKTWHFDFKRVCFSGSLFLISVAGVTYSINPKAGLYLLETRIPLLLFPIIFSLEQISQEEVNNFLKHYLSSIIVTFIVTTLIAVYRNVHGPMPDIWFNKWYYHYSDLTSPIKIDPLYLALFVSFALVILLLDQFKEKDSRIIKNRGIVIGLLMLFGLFLVMIAVRSIIIILVFLICIIIVQNRKRIERKFLTLAFSLTVLILGLSVLSPVTRDRFEGLYKSKFEFSNYTIDRFVIWSVAAGYIVENPSEFIIGKGTGGSVKLMDELYKKEGIQWDFANKTNTHNQYLGFLLDTGFIGLFVLLSFIVFSFAFFYKNKDTLGMIFIILMATAMISENYLNRQKGVMFFSFFYSAFYFARKANSKPNML